MQEIFLVGWLVLKCRDHPNGIPVLSELSSSSLLGIVGLEGAEISDRPNLVKNSKDILYQSFITQNIRNVMVVPNSYYHSLSISKLNRRSVQLLTLPEFTKQGSILI